MVGRPDSSDPERERRRKLVRKATLYTVGFFAAAVAVAAAGAALVALILTTQGLPFLETWGVVAALALAVPLLVAAVRALLDR